MVNKTKNLLILVGFLFSNSKIVFCGKNCFLLNYFTSQKLFVTKIIFYY